MNAQLKILLYIGIVVGILYFLQTKYSLFDISFEKPFNRKNVEESIEEGKESLEILNSEGKKIYVEVEVADTPDLRYQGLSGREELGDYQGMLFVFDTDDIYSFVMRDMLLSLDIIYIDYSGYIVDYKENLPVCEQENCQSILASKPFRYALEVNSGFVEINKVEIGNAVIFNISSQE